MLGPIGTMKELYYTCHFCKHAVFAVNTMPFSLEAIKSIDQRTQDIANGFIRASQSLIINDNHPYYNIPSLVFVITVLYYYNPEYFTIHGQFIKLNKDKDTVTLTNEYSFISGTAYGNVIIDKRSKGSHIWTFSVVKPDCSGQGEMTIGIDSSRKKFADDCMYVSHRKEYAYYGYVSFNDGDDACTAIRTYNAKLDHKHYECEYGVIYSDTESEVKMELNMRNRTLKYYVNDTDQGIAFDNICFQNDEQYTMVVCLAYEVMSVQLTNYQHV